MKTEIKKLPKSIIKVSVLLTKEEFQPYWDEAKDTASKGVAVKGFRPGTAPKALVEGNLNESAVFEYAVNEAVRKTLNEIVKENKWNLVDAPQIDLTPNPEGLSYDAELSLFPEVKVSGYKDLAKKKKESFKDDEIKIEDKEIEDSVNWLLKSRGLTEVNEEFLKSIGDFKDLEDLKKNIHEGMTEEKKLREKDRRRLAVLDEVVKASEAEVPVAMIKKQAEHLANETKQMIASATGSVEEYFAKYYPDIKKFEEEMEAQAHETIMKNLVIQEIAKIEELLPTKEEIEADANEVLRSYARENVKDLDMKILYDYSYGRVLNKKVFEFLENI